MRTIILFVSFLLSFGRLNAQNYYTQWLKGIPVSSLGTQNIASDSKLNVYSIGMFSTTIDFDPGPGVHSLSPIDSTDGFILKLDSAGNFQWAIPIGGLRSVYCYYISIDNDDNVIVEGSFSGSVDFDPSSATAIKVSVGDNNTFLAKYDGSGKLIWAKSFEGRAFGAIAINGDNKIFMAGFYQDTVDFDLGIGVYKLEGSAGYILSLEPDGSFNFCKKVNGASFLNIKISPNNSLVTSGSGPTIPFTIDLDPSASDYIISGLGYFIAYYSDTGAFQKALFFEGKYSPSTAEYYDIKINDFIISKDKSLYLTGSFYGYPDFDVNADSFKLSADKYGDVFVMKYDSSSKFVWAKSFGDSEYDRGTSICLDKSSNIYVGGEFTGTPDFDPASATKYTSSFGGRDLFISRFTNSGDFDWVKTMGSSGFDFNGKMLLDAQENLIQSGQFQGTAYFDDSGYFYLSSTSPSSIFIHKLRNTPLSQKEILSQQEFKIYPNPTVGILNLNFNGIEMKGITLMDVVGKTVYIQNGKFRNAFTIDLRPYSLKGFYFIQAISENGVFYYSPVIFE